MRALSAQNFAGAASCTKETPSRTRAMDGSHNSLLALALNVTAVRDLDNTRTTERLAAVPPARTNHPAPLARFLAHDILRVFVLPNSEKHGLAKLLIAGPF